MKYLMKVGIVCCVVKVECILIVVLKCVCGYWLLNGCYCAFVMFVDVVGYIGYVRTLVLMMG